MKRIMIYGILFILISFGCTKKKNITGFNQIFEIKSKTLDYNQFDRFYSYEDSIKNSDSANLVMGNFNNIESNILMKFKSFPDSVFEIQNAKLKLIITKRENFDDITSNDIKFGLLQKDWIENKATWFTTGDTINWLGDEFSTDDFTDEINTSEFEAVEDTIFVNFDNEIIKTWINSDSLNFGFVIYTEKDSSFISFNSSEIGADEFEPTLTFDYKITESDTLQSYSRNSYYDTFIYHKIDNGNLNYFDNAMMCKGMMPTKFFTHFNINDTLFISDSLSGITSNYDYKRMSILKAELILHPNIENDTYPLDASIGIKPYLVISDSVNSANPEIPFEYNVDYISYGKTSTDSLNTPIFKIDVTSAIQTMISGKYINSGSENNYTNYGLIFKMITENQSLKYIRFYTNDATDELNRPKIVIKYVIPIFN